MMKRTKRIRAAAALIADCDPKTVDRYLDTDLPVQKETKLLLQYALAIPALMLLERADELGRIARERTGGKRK